ncbi:WD40/YVTN/BNR-like repeat-containing protein, partial [candidate division KSB1 bacterium]
GKAEYGGAVIKDLAGGGVIRYKDFRVNKTSLMKTTVGALAFDSNGIIYAGTCKSYTSGGVFEGTGLYVSLDDGLTWENTGLQENNILSLAVDGDDNVFAGTEDNGIFMSGNSGDSWRSIGPPASGETRMIRTDSEGSLYAVVNYNKLYIGIK